MSDDMTHNKIIKMEYVRVRLSQQWKNIHRKCLLNHMDFSTSTIYFNERSETLEFERCLNMLELCYQYDDDDSVRANVGRPN